MKITHFICFFILMIIVAVYINFKRKLFSTLPARVVWPKIFLFGDSITEYSFSDEGCWGSILAHNFQRRADIISRGFAGYNTRSCLEILPHIATKQDLEGVVISVVFLGTNDATIRPENKSFMVPIDEYSENLRKIVKHFKNNGVKTVVLITPPALDSIQWLHNCGPKGCFFNKSEALTTEYANSCITTALELSIPFVNLHSSMLNQVEWRSYLSDGIHLSNKGSKLLASLLVPIISKNMDVKENLDQLLPQMRNVDLDNPHKSIDEWIRNNVK